MKLSIEAIMAIISLLVALPPTLLLLYTWFRRRAADRSYYIYAQPDSMLLGRADRNKVQHGYDRHVNATTMLPPGVIESTVRRYHIEMIEFDLEGDRAC